MKRLIGLTVAGLLVISIFSSFGFASTQVILKDISGHEFEFEIKKLVEAGIVKGFPDATFRPEGLITRADTSILIALAKKLPLVRPAVSPFRDLPTTHYAYGHIVAAQKAGYLKGYPDGTFRPAANVNRSELAVILGQVKGLAAEAAKITTPLVIAQDEVAIPKWASGWITLGVRPQHQYLSYRSIGEFSVIAPLAPATRAEVAYGLHQVLYPPKPGGVVNIGIFTEPDTMNMFVGPTLMAWVPWSLINIPTVGRNHNWSLYPGTLQVIPTVENGLWKVVGDDRMEVTYRLRPGLRWQDGEPVTLDDWAYTFLAFMDPLVPSIRTVEEKIDFTKGAGAYNIKGFDLLTPDSVRVYFKELDWRANLWMPGSMELTGLYPKHLLEGPYTEMKRLGRPDVFIKDETLARRPLGLGPFKLREWLPGSQMLFEKNPDFFLGPSLY